MGRLLLPGLLICVTFAGGCTRPTTEESAKQKKPAETKSVTEEEKAQGYLCLRTRGKIKLDGVLDEPDWQRAKRIEFIPLGEAPAGQKRPTSAYGKLLYDENNLYIAMAAQDKNIWATIEKHDADIFTEDVLEAFFKPSKTHPTYFEFEWSPNNVTLDLVVPGFRKEYESKAKSAVKIYGTLNDPEDTDKKWVVEVAIPFSAFNPPVDAPTPGDQWTFILARYDYLVYKNKEVFQLSATAKLSKASFHLWQEYETLVFGR